MDYPALALCLQVTILLHKCTSVSCFSSFTSLTPNPSFCSSATTLYSPSLRLAIFVIVTHLSFTLPVSLCHLVQSFTRTPCLVSRIEFRLRNSNRFAAALTREVTCFKISCNINHSEETFQVLHEEQCNKLYTLVSYRSSWTLRTGCAEAISYNYRSNKETHSFISTAFVYQVVDFYTHVTNKTRETWVAVVVTARKMVRLKMM